MGHSVNSALAAGIAAQNSPDSHGNTANYAILLNGLITIFRAAGIEFTVAMREEDFWETMIW